VKSGSIAFLKEEYKYLAIFVVCLGAVLTLLYCVNPVVEDEVNDGFRMGFAFVMGAFLSGIAGFFGMMVATDGNVRTTVACQQGSLNNGLRVAFTAGSVMGFTVVGLGLFGLGLVFWVIQIDRQPAETMQLMAGFGFGASSIALFARVAGGIYTKAADVGADLVGKVEAGIDEDDPHNPAVIADNVGDNVGDVAGMGADLFESYVGSVIACATIGANHPTTLILPFWLATLGTVCSFFGFFAVSTKEEGNGWNVKLGALMWALEKGMYVSAFLFVGLAALLIWMLFDSEDGWKIYGCILLGLVAGAAIGKVTEYFTSFDFGPVISIKDRATTGPATVVIQGLGVGMISTLAPIVILCAAILGCNELAGSYGISIAAVGMLATLGITLATDAYGPVADNAGGLAEMAGLGPEVRAKTDSLDALGNTTAATGKGFAIGSAVLTSLSLLAAYRQQIGVVKDEKTGLPLNYDVSDALVLTGLLFGAMLPYLFAALTMISVGKAAAEIIEEVRRQFRELKHPTTGRTLREAIIRASNGETIPEEEDVEPDSDRCVQISTRSSVKEMIAPGAYAILTPLIVGFTLGPRCLMGVLAGAIVSGAMLAIMMSNAGGAWDNSKKLCEKLKIKKTDQGKACVVGDTVGDPFKDTSGPALNILIKLMSMVALTIAPLLRSKDDNTKITEGNDDWENWYWGMIPLGLALVLTAILMFKKILTWKDPLAEKKTEQAAQFRSSSVEGRNPEEPKADNAEKPAEKPAQEEKSSVEI
jgi:inorganic pyrophosphatase